MQIWDAASSLLTFVQNSDLLWNQLHLVMMDGPRKSAAIYPRPNTNSVSAISGKPAAFTA